MPEIILVPEDGTGVADANTYVTIERADEILNERGRVKEWIEADLHEKQRALISAFRVLNQLNWKGERSTQTQRGAWPRADVINEYGDAVLDADAIPERLEYAQAALARRFLKDDLFERADQKAVQGSSASSRSRSVQAGHPRNLAIVPDEVLNDIRCFLHLHAIKLVRAA